VEATTVQLQNLLVRLNAGDSAARDELFNRAYERLQRLTRKMLGSFPGVRAAEETGDVLHDSALRLRQALESVRPATVREFFQLAARQIRWQLLDLARRHGRPSAPHPLPSVPSPGDTAEGTGRPGLEAGDTTYDPDRLAAWGEIHARVETLPEEEREVFDLLWYQELTQAEAAEVLGVSKSTVKLRWVSARLRLQEVLGDEFV
jgi:RNA polymerase sigma-70 factor (ECF subfamily)